MKPDNDKRTPWAKWVLPADEGGDVPSLDDMIVGESRATKLVRGQVAKVAPTASNVLITGESGTGKELVAKAVHALSPRSARHLVPINCGAIPEALLESQLFGHVRGAFTSAHQANPGLFVTADHGTLFLDEIGELPYHLQVKLLRVLVEREVWPVGGTAAVPVDVRVIAATNRDLLADVESGRCRADLYYRLNVAHIVIPPLRERPADIPALVAHMMRRLNARLGTRFTAVDREALQVLVECPWRGNVRELENVLERAMILSEGDTVKVADLPEDVLASRRELPVPADLRTATQGFERRYVLEVLERAQFDKREAARLLGISLASLYRKLGQDGDR